MCWRDGSTCTPQAQNIYLSRLQKLLNDLWLEEDILADIDRMEELLAPHITAYEDFITQSISDVRDYVGMRRGQLETILAESPAIWDQPLREPWCLDSNGDVSGDFNGSWDTLNAADPFTEGTGLIDLTVDEESYEQQTTAVIAGVDENEQSVVRLLFWASELRLIVIEIPLDELDLESTMPQNFEIAP